MRAIPPGDGVGVDQAQVDLVVQGRGLQSVAWTLAAQITRRDSPQLAVDRLHQLLGRLLLAPLPGQQESGDVVARVGG